MDKEEMIWLASVAIGKKLNFETLKYSDYLYGKESLVDDVWKYVTECEEIGTIAFKEKYSQYKLYF